MSSGLYDKGREKFLGGGSQVNWTVDNIKVVLVNTSLYTVDLANHEFLSDVAAGARVATSGNLGSKTNTAGVANAASTTFTAVSGAVSSALIIYKDTGTASTSPLLAYI